MKSFSCSFLACEILFVAVELKDAFEISYCYSSKLLMCLLWFEVFCVLAFPGGEPLKRNPREQFNTVSSWFKVQRNLPIHAELLWKCNRTYRQAWSLENSKVSPLPLALQSNFLYWKSISVNHKLGSSMREQWMVEQLHYKNLQLLPSNYLPCPSYSSFILYINWGVIMFSGLTTLNNVVSTLETVLQRVPWGGVTL